MSKTTHFLIIPVLFVAVHWTQLGTELVARTMGRYCPPPLRAVSEAATTVSLWLLVLYLIPLAAKLTLWVYGACGWLLDVTVEHGRHKAVQLLTWLINWLNH